MRLTSLNVSTGGFGPVVAIAGPFWEGFKWVQASSTVETGIDELHATMMICAESIYAIDKDGNEIEGTKKGPMYVLRLFFDQVLKSSRQTCVFVLHFPGHNNVITTYVHSEVRHHIVVDNDGKIIEWRQEFDSEVTSDNLT